MQKRREIERSKDEVRLIRDRAEPGRHTKRKSHIERPVRRSGDRDGFRAHTHREDFGGVGPGDGADGDGEGAYGEIRTDDDALRDASFIRWYTPDLSTVEIDPVPEFALQASDEHEEETHEAEAAEEEGTTAPAVDEDDGGDCLGGGGVEVKMCIPISNCIKGKTARRTDW